MTEAQLKKKLTIIPLGNSSDGFLKYLDEIELSIGDMIDVCEVEGFDGSRIILHKKKPITLSKEAASRLLVNVT